MSTSLFKSFDPSTLPSIPSETWAGKELTTSGDIQSLLSSTPYATDELELLSGGLTNFTFRVKLKTPFAIEGEGDGENVSKVESVVVKHAEPYPRGIPEFRLSSNRSDLEFLLLSSVSPVSGSDSNVTVTTPRAYTTLPPTRTFIIQDFPKTTTLKSALLSDSIPTNLAASIGRALAKYSISLYSWSRQPAQEELQEKIAKYEWSKDISFAVTYDHVSSIAESFKEEIGSERVLDAAEKLKEKARKDLFEKNENWGLIHGDYWTGNILIPESVKDGESVPLHLVDWEVAKLSVPYFDIGQMLAELYLPLHFNGIESCQAAIDGLCEEVRNSEYSKIPGFMTGSAAHFGVHLVVWPYQTGWPEEKLSECVKLGGEFITRAGEGDEEWLTGSVLGKLFA